MAIQESIYEDMINALKSEGGYLCTPEEREKLRKTLWPDGITLNRDVVARPALHIAELAETFWGEAEVECFGHRYQTDALPAYVACEGDEIVGAVSFAREGGAMNLVMLHVSPQ